MGDELKFDYYYGEEADLFTFYRIPKILISDNRFKTISSDAKILYGIMLDRMSLSMKNGWFDDNNRVYIYFSVEDTEEYLNVGKNKAIKTLAELDTESGIGLIERVRQGQGKSTKVYIRKFIDDASEVYDLNFKKFTNQTSRSPESKPQEVYKSNPNNTYFNNTENNNTIHIDSISADVDYENVIRDNLNMEMLVARNPLQADLIVELLSLIVECAVSRSETIVIASNRYPTSFVRAKFLKLRIEHIEYVLHCFKKNTSKVKNIKKYLLAALFNAPSTIDSFYLAEVNHDINNPA